MSERRLSGINMLDALLKGGRPEDDTAALIYDGTLPSQRTVQATLGRITSTDPGSGDPRILQFGLKFVF